MEQEQLFIDYIEQSIIQNWDRNALTDYQGITLQYKDVARKIAKFHIVLESAGIQPGDKIAVCGRNSAHWAVCFLATVTYGAVIVPILHEFKADNIHNIVNHSEAKLLFVGDRAWENLNEEAMPLLMGVVLLTDFTPVVCRDERLMEAFEHRNAIYGARYPKNFRPEHICYRKEQSPEELAVINYTSGTTGYSKGVMLPYRSLWSNIAYCHEMLPVHPGDHIVSMLPLGHVFGMVYDFLYGFSAGAHLYFLTRMPSPKIIAQSFSEIKPRVISCVPLIVEKIIKKNILPLIDNKIGKLLLRMPIVNDKICTVYIKRNIIEKWLACSTVMLKQALNATDRNRGADVRIYGSDSATTFLDWWLGKDYASSQPIVSAQSGYGLLGYTIRFDLLVSLAAGIALCYFQYYGWLWVPVVYMLISLIKGIFAVRRSSITLKEDYVEINSGKFAEVKNYFKYSNMEVVRMTATPFTPFYHRVNLVISTNGSSFTVRSLKEQEAKEIYELLLYNCYIK